ncbi:MAG: SulP family inorganic anion transporter [Planctomycetes bacterium]|nr:SulP family inorganic anion transporter [Planctomycetota bacterium]
MAEPSVPNGTERTAPPGPRASRCADLLSGLLVFLIAMPLCLAIARGSNYPPVAGIWTAVIGGIVTTFVSNSPLTIKGPAAGLIVIAAGAVADLGKEFCPALPTDEVAALRAENRTDDEIARRAEARQLEAGYRLALGVGVAAAAIQVLLGLLRAGSLGDLFPLAAIRGMLASIGVIIISKQAYEVLGGVPEKGAGPLRLLADLPEAVRDYNPAVACVGLVGLAILFGLPFAPGRTKRIPAPLLVLLAAVPLGLVFSFATEHAYVFHDGVLCTENRAYQAGPRFLVNVPDVKADPGAAFALPDLRGVPTPTGLKYVALFAVIGSLESLLAAKALDLLDPWRRKTDLSRDLLATGVANAVCSAVGALPMISEIVRSKANVDNGGRTKYANFFHGVFLLVFVVLVPGLICHIPLAALGAMLVYTGFRLAHPREFVRYWRIGRGQFVVFVGTILATLATDPLVGIAAGVLLEAALHLCNGVPLRSLFVFDAEVVKRGGCEFQIVVHRAAVFGNWPALKRKIARLGPDADVTVDLSGARFVDHTVMEKLHETEREFEARGRSFVVTGLDGHRPLSSHPLAARKKLIPRCSCRKREEPDWPEYPRGCP